MNQYSIPYGRAALTAVVIALAPAVASAQLRATSVQLPTFNYFATSTTVEVPDGGTAFLGGTSGSATGRSEHGLPGLGFLPGLGNRAIGSTSAASGMSVSATIHDFDAMDRQLLGEDFDKSAATDTSARAAALANLPVMLRPLSGRATAAAHSAPQASPLAVDAAGSGSVNEIRRQQAAEDEATQSEAATLFQQASDLQAQGKPGVAKIYYQMAARRATGNLKEEALAALRSLSAGQQAAAAEPLRGCSAARDPTVAQPVGFRQPWRAGTYIFGPTAVNQESQH